MRETGDAASGERVRPHEQGRQKAMADSYRDLIADRTAAVLAYHADFESHRDRLAACSGRILDIGGGNGIVRHFPASDIDYVSLDPMTEWLDDLTLEFRRAWDS